MGTALRRIVLLVAAVAVVASCSVTRHIPDGQYMLKRNTVVSDKDAPKDERITAEDVETYIQQSPNKRFLGTNVNLWIYAMSNPDKQRWTDRLLRKIGTAPVILDTMSVKKSSGYITTKVHSKGFFDGSSTYRIDSARKKAAVGYLITQREPYRIGDITYNFKDKFLKPVIMQDSANTLLHTGDLFDSDVRAAEQRRIKNYLQNRGYYNFNIGNVRYNAFWGDTVAGDRDIDLEVVIEQFLSEYDQDGKPVMSNNTIYRIGRINVYPDYDPMRAATDTSYMNNVDTLEYNGINIIYGNKLRIRKEILRQNISLQDNYLFSAADVSRTYNNLTRLGYYRSERIMFADMPDTTQNFVTFIGAGGQHDPGEQTSEKYLLCNIYCTPSLRQGYNIGGEVTFTSDYYGLSATLGYRNRSLFRGAEMFDVTFKGSYDFMRVQGKDAAFEFGGTTSLTFPRFLLPFRSHALSKVSNPRTKVELSINAQRRPYYSRVLSNASWGYSWSGNRYTNFSLRPIDVSLVKMNYIDPEFLAQLKNPYLIDSYQDQLIAGISGSYVFNNQSLSSRGKSLNVRLNVETTGNLLDAMCSLFGNQRSGEDYYRILGIRFAQYLRADLSVTQSLPVGDKLTLVGRLYGGAGYTYGNSTVMPNDRLFYAGGSFSMRGWAARTLGPGNEARPDPKDQPYPNQLGNMRLEANLEGRFPIWSIVGGALFFDAGNVWFTGQGDQSIPESIFHFNSFYKQLGLNTGVGVRVDISMAVLRVDWGIRLHDPNLPQGQRWINNFRLKNTALSIAVGYPF